MEATLPWWPGWSQRRNFSNLFPPLNQSLHRARSTYLHREPFTWLEVYTYLTQSGGVKAVQPAEAYAKSSKGG